MFGRKKAQKVSDTDISYSFRSGLLLTTFVIRHFPMTPHIEMRGIVKSFPGVKALRGVSLSLRAGDVLARIGENGAGKSTLMKVLGGAHLADQGVIEIDGRETDFRSPQDSRNAGVAVIYQEFNLVPGLNAVENIFLGQEVTSGGLIAQRQERKRAAELFARLGIAMDLDTPCGRLNTAQQQLVEIAKALAFDARIIVMEEPSSARAVHPLTESCMSCMSLRR